LDRKKQIGLRIRTMRKSRRMTQRDLARAIDQSQSSITMYETGRREPDFETLEALADVFNVPLSAFVIDDEPVYHSTVPLIVTTCEAEEIATTVDKLPYEQRQQALNVLRAMFRRYSKESDQEE